MAPEVLIITLYELTTDDLILSVTEVAWHQSS